jgi:hypothetical protein
MRRPICLGRLGILGELILADPSQAALHQRLDATAIGLLGF